MQFSNVALVVTFCSIIFVSAQDEEDEDEEEPVTIAITTIPTDVSEESNEVKWTKAMQQHKFVALLDIVFTNGGKKYCTGTIIHEFVVITAAHCFVTHVQKVVPELSTSFVVIGSNKMFETGYEHYLPIERILTHPKFDDITADLSLVYTFVSMTIDKPATVLPLSGERTTTPVDSNITVLSWGRFQDDESEYTVPGVTANIPVKASDSSVNHYKYALRKEMEGKQFRKRDTDLNKDNLRSRSERTSKLASRYLTSKENFTDDNSEYDDADVNVQLNGHLMDDIYAERFINPERKTEHIKTSRLPPKRTKMIRIRRVNRRQMESKVKENKLAIEMFGFINMQTCKKYVEKTSPSTHPTKNTNDFVCFIGESRHITMKDSGAPVIYKGKLVAVTVSGAECDSDSIGIGLKMSCYCSWIANNLPTSNLTCCKNCCDVKHEKDAIEMRNHKNILL